jgi:hypothetical protein
MEQTTEKSWFDSRQKKRDFLFTETLRMALKLTPVASRRMMGTLSWREERLKREADHSLPPTAEVQKAWSCTSTPPPPSWRALE